MDQHWLDIIAGTWDCLADIEQLAAENGSFMAAENSSFPPSSNPLVKLSGSKAIPLSQWLQDKAERLAACQQGMAEWGDEHWSPEHLEQDLIWLSGEVEEGLSCFQRWVAAPGEPCGDFVVPLDEEQLRVELDMEDEVEGDEEQVRGCGAGDCVCKTGAKARHVQTDVAVGWSTACGNPCAKLVQHAQQGS